jgi:hypothetical protein
VPAVIVRSPFKVRREVEPAIYKVYPGLLIMMLLNVLALALPVMYWLAVVESNVTVLVLGVNVAPLLVQSPPTVNVPVGAVNVPADSVTDPLISRLAVPPVNVPPDMANDPEHVIEDAPAVNVPFDWEYEPTDTGLSLELKLPELRVNAPETVNEFPAAMVTVPVLYPVSKVRVATDAAVSMEQFWVDPALNIAVSAVVGTENPAVPPEVSDQLVMEFQLPDEGATQYRVTAPNTQFALLLPPLLDELAVIVLSA